jgi:DNA-3-methyladenine glycosylase II
MPPRAATAHHPRHHATTELELAVRHLRRRDRELRRVIDAAGPCRLRPNRHYFPTLLGSIVGQQLSGAAADTIWGRLCAHFPGSRSPRPEVLLATGDADLRALGLSRAKVASVKDLSAHVLDGRLDLHHLSRLDDGQVVEALVAVRGIGEWTAHMFMMFSLFRLDVLPTGDLGIRKGFQRVYGLPALPTTAQMHEIADAKQWSPYRSVACWYLWRALE